jgi:hypothetical protein
MLRTALRLASLVGALMLVTTSVAIAAPGGNKSSSSSSISLVTTTAAASAAASTGSPTYGTAVTFAASTDATSQPFVHLRCFQNGTLVLESWQAWAYSDHMFMLGGSPAWTDGAGDCTAYLENWDSYSKNGRTAVLASTTFHVDA